MLPIQDSLATQSQTVQFVLKHHLKLAALYAKLDIKQIWELVLLKVVMFKTVSNAIVLVKPVQHAWRDTNYQVLNVPSKYSHVAFKIVYTAIRLTCVASVPLDTSQSPIHRLRLGLGQQQFRVAS